jgi:hypothetical protein
VPGINADGGWMLVFGAYNWSTAGILLVNLMEPECEGKQNHGTSDKAEHEPDE